MANNKTQSGSKTSALPEVRAVRSMEQALAVEASAAKVRKSAKAREEELENKDVVVSDQDVAEAPGMNGDIIVAQASTAAAPASSSAAPAAAAAAEAAALNPMWLIAGAVGVAAVASSSDSSTPAATVSTAAATPAASTASTSAAASTTTTAPAVSTPAVTVPAALSFTLTTGQNTFTGDALANTFDATVMDSLSINDTLDGGAGTDRLTAYVSGTALASGVSINNIETVNIVGTGAGFTLDASTAGKFADLKTLSVEAGTGGAIAVTTKSNVTSVTTVGGAATTITDSGTADTLTTASITKNITTAAVITSDVLSNLTVADSAVSGWTSQLVLVF